MAPLFQEEENRVREGEGRTDPNQSPKGGGRKEGGGGKFYL